MKAKDKEVTPPTTTPSKTAISNYGRRNNLPEHVQVISVSFCSGADTPKKGERSASSRWFQRFQSVQVTWARVSVRRSGGLCGGGRCSSHGHQKQRGQSQVQVPTSPSRTWLKDLTFFHSSPRGFMRPGNTTAWWPTKPSVTESGWGRRAFRV